MNILANYHKSLGATLADDGIPLHYGNLTQEYQNAFNGAILLDRSHEGRLLLTGDDRFDLVNRMSTNKVINVALHEGCPTIFTNANARILFRVIVYNRPEGLLMITEPGQGDAVTDYLQSNIFYGDKVKVIDIQPLTHHFAIHGMLANITIEKIESELSQLPEFYSMEIQYKDVEFTVLRRKAIVGQHWAIICQNNDAVRLHQLLSEMELQSAGSLSYNILRIQSGRPAGLELSKDYIPLEVGLWDEVSFSKGCYTGQEIIARMESRERLAKTIVKLDLSSFVKAPATVYDGDRIIGIMTSSVESPIGQSFAIAVLKTDIIQIDRQLMVGENRVPVTIKGYAGKQPSFIYEQNG